MNIKETLESIENNLVESYNALQENGATMPEKKNLANLSETVKTFPKGIDSVVNGVIEKYLSQAGTVSANTFIQFVNDFSGWEQAESTKVVTASVSDSISAYTTFNAILVRDNIVFLSGVIGTSLKGVAIKISPDNMTTGTVLTIDASNIGTGGNGGSTSIAIDGDVFLLYGKDEVSSYSGTKYGILYRQKLLISDDLVITKNSLSSLYISHPNSYSDNYAYFECRDVATIGVGDGKWLCSYSYYWKRSNTGDLYMGISLHGRNNEIHTSLNQLDEVGTDNSADFVMIDEYNYLWGLYSSSTSSSVSFKLVTLDESKTTFTSKKIPLSEYSLTGNLYYNRIIHLYDDYYMIIGSNANKPVAIWFEFKSGVATCKSILRFGNAGQRPTILHDEESRRIQVINNDFSSKETVSFYTLEYDPSNFEITLLGVNTENQRIGEILYPIKGIVIDKDLYLSLLPSTQSSIYVSRYTPEKGSIKVIPAKKFNGICGITQSTCTPEEEGEVYVLNS